MIKVEQIDIGGRSYAKTYSDSGYMIMRDGQYYSEAIDPLRTGRLYTETDMLIEKEEDTDERAD